MSCNSDESRQEQVEKLRALGVSIQPLAAAPGTLVVMTYFLAGPPGLVLKTEVFADSDSNVALNAPSSVDNTSLKETNFGNLSLYQFSGNVTIPVEAQSFLFGPTPVRSRYGARVSSTAGDEQKIVGDILIYNPGSKELLYSSPTVNIVDPTAQVLTAGAVQSVNLNYNPVNNENFRVGWFVSGGQIKNRRAKSTDWTVPSNAGSHTLIATLRGVKSAAFSIKVIQVTVQ